MGQLAQRAQQQQRDLLDDANAGRRATCRSCSATSGPAAWTKPRWSATAPIRSRRCWRASTASSARKDIPPAIAALHQVGIPVAFNFGADVDLRDLVAPHRLLQPGRPRPARPGLLHAHRCRHARAARPLHRLRVEDPRPDRQPAGQLAADTQAVLDLETRIAQASQAAGVDCATPRANYAPVATASSASSTSACSWTNSSRRRASATTRVSIANPQLFAQLDALVGAPEARRNGKPTCATRSACDGALPVQGVARCRFRVPRPRAARADRAAAAPATGARRDQRRRRPDGRPRIRRRATCRRDERTRATEIATQVRDALGPRHRPQHLDECRGKDRSQGEARQAQDRNRRAGAATSTTACSRWAAAVSAATC